LYERGKKKIFYIDCMRKNGVAMLKLADHDSMSGEHIEINSGMIVTSGKSMIWPIEALENHGFRRLGKFTKRGKMSWAKLIKEHM
jgi:hypothetical protein